MQFPGQPGLPGSFPPAQQAPQAFPQGQMDPAAAQQYAQQYWQYMMYYQQMQQQQQAAQAQQMQMMQMQQQQQQAAMMAQHQQPMGGAPMGGGAGGAAGGQSGGGVIPQPNDQGLYVLFVYHLPHNITEDMLRSMFGKYGNIAEIVIMRDDNNDPNSRTKGYGFVKYQNYNEAAAAVQYLNGAQLENKRLEVSFKLPKGQRR